jgi:hypothetical protein
MQVVYLHLQLEGGFADDGAALTLPADPSETDQLLLDLLGPYDSVLMVPGTF